jgi:PKD repeat protein
MNVKVISLIFLCAIALTGLVSAECDGCPTAAYYVYNIDYSKLHTVQFYDASGGCPVYRLWDLGNGRYSMSVNPKITYMSSGVYKVKLSVKGAEGHWSYYQSNVYVP